jgi:hypothetical protein
MYDVCCHHTQRQGLIMPAKRVSNIEKWDDIDEVRVYGPERGADGKVRGNVVGAITKLDGEIEFHFPQSITMTKEQAAFIAAHIITLITT